MMWGLGAPEEWLVCDTCFGEGVVGTGRMSHSVNSATLDPPDEIMEPCRGCGGSGGWIVAVVTSGTCNYPNCDGGYAAGYCHNDCRASLPSGEQP